MQRYFCTTCGEETNNNGTLLCDSCWKLDGAFRRLRGCSLQNAQKWLVTKLLDVEKRLANVK